MQEQKLNYLQLRLLRSLIAVAQGIFTLVMGPLVLLWFAFNGYVIIYSIFHLLGLNQREGFGSTPLHPIGWIIIAVGYGLWLTGGLSRISAIFSRLDEFKGKLGERLSPSNEKATYQGGIPFHSWLQRQKDDLNLEDALERYIEEYNLLKPTKLGEPVELTKIVARLKILEGSRNYFDPEARDDLERYIFMLNGNLMMEHMRWEAEQKHAAIRKRLKSDDETREE